MNSALGVALVVATTAIGGALTGSVGVGGVLLVPALVYLGGLDIHRPTGCCRRGRSG